MPRQRKVKVWNGSAPDPVSHKYVHVYIGAYSMKHAAELLVENGFGWYTAYQIKGWWSPCWGYAMDGIEPEVGIWTTSSSGPEGTPKRII